MNEPSWDDYADSWDDDADVRRYASLAFASLSEHVLDGLPGTRRALDFGCGTGLLSMKLAERFEQVVALDVSAKMVDVLDRKIRTSSRNNVVTVVGDIEDPKFTHDALVDARFDLIVASSVCAFLTDLDGATKRLARLLSPGGVFVQWDWLAGPDDEFGLTPERVRAAYSGAGLEAARLEPTFALEGKAGTLDVLMGVGRR